MNTLSAQAQNNISLCRGNEKGKIMLLWEMANVSPSIIDELSKHFGVANTRSAVAEVLSRM